MSVLDKIKKLDKNKITYEPLIEQVDKALSNYKNKNALLAQEKVNYEKLYSMVVEHFPEAAGIAKTPAIEKVEKNDLMNYLKENKRS